ncbi:hypothetical protein MTP99_013552 [Tenebrio molitor]|nr:hypothetical protein MTP99_013552 [Tenebrio molitor]
MEVVPDATAAGRRWRIGVSLHAYIFIEIERQRRWSRSGNRVVCSRGSRRKMSTFREISASETRTLQQVAYAFSMMKVQQHLDSRRCHCFGSRFEIVQRASTDNIKLIVNSDSERVAW